MDGRYYGQAEPRVFEAQLNQPGDVSGVEAFTVLDEVLGLATVRAEAGVQAGQDGHADGQGRHHH